MGFFILKKISYLCGMISEKLKQVIFKELYSQLKGVDIIHYNGSIWFINRSDRYWYLELNSNNHLWWRYSFFVDFFQFFSLNIYEFEPLIREWTEWVLNRRISKIATGHYGCRQLLEDMLNSNIESSNHSEYNIDFISNYNILTTCGNVGNGFYYNTKIEMVLNQPDV